ncbi:PAS domain S-box protein [Spirulina subsalsa FACHB-351]|uniref:histidine kinase n=1 Tax=Spirulina subsalsa FACHB-351 TaxID=234711 RepID=A0ABT3L505_9CYAN|nr:PAS domain S-box protein [Spirulina subsalsa]MCW6036542.1 PAS domain S-box protein [Spirulina subsalsa FACHB-351]
MQSDSFSSIDVTEAIFPHPHVISPTATLVEAIALMSGLCTPESASPAPQAPGEYGGGVSSCVLVVVETDSDQDQGRQLVGILTERDIVRLSAQQRDIRELSVGEVMTQPVLTLRPSELTDIFSLLHFLEQHCLRHVPIVDEQERLMGLISHESLRNLARPADLLRLRSVQEVMTQKVLTAHPDTSMLEIAQLLAENRLSSVILTRPPERGDLREYPLGIVTERDVVKFQVLGGNLGETRAEEVMSSPLFTMRPEADLWAAQQEMEKRRIRRVVVTGEGGELLGIITQTSLLQAFNPLELYRLAEVLEQKVARLEVERVTLLERRTRELEQQVEERTQIIEAQAERVRLLLEIATSLRNSLDLPTILQTAVDEVRQVLQCDRVMIYQLEEGLRGEIIAESMISGGRSVLHREANDPCVTSEWLESYRQGRVRVVRDIYDESISLCHQEMLLSFEIRAKLMVPIVLEDHLWGLMIASCRDQPRDWQTWEIELLQALSLQLAIALQQASQHQQLQNEIRERQQAQQDLAALNAQLEARVAQRTAELESREARYHALMEGASDAILLTTPQGYIIEANAAAEELFGYSRSELTQMHYSQLCPPEELHPMTQVWESLVNPQQRILWDGLILHADGHSIPVALSGTMIQVGDSIIFQGILRDISARQQAEATLAQLSQRLSIALSSAALGCWEWDIAQNCLTWDKRMYALYGIEPSPTDDPSGVTMPYEVWSKGVHPEDRQRTETLLQQALLGAAEYNTEFRVVHPDGSLHYIRAYGVVLRDGAGHPQSMIGVNLDVTDTHQAQRELQASETRFRQVFDSNVVGMMFTNFTGDITEANDRFLAMLGYNRDDLNAGRLNWADLTPPEYQQQDVEAIYHLLTYNFIDPFEKVYLHQDGHPVAVLLGVAMVCPAEGTCVCVVVDISDRKQAEIALQESQLRLELALESSNTGLWDWNMPTGTVWFNKQWKAMLGYGEDELENQLSEWESRVHPDDLAHTYQEVEQHRQGQTDVYRNEHRLRGKDGSYRWILAQGRIIEWDGAGNPLRFIGTHTDISDRKNNELERQKLLQELSSFKFALDQSAIVVTTNLKGKILYVNDRFESISGYSQAEILGKTPRILNSQHHPPEFFAHLWTTILNGQVWRNEICNRAKNGQIYWVDATIIPFLNPQGQPTQFLSIQFDITPRKQVELDLASSNSLLSTITHAQAQFITAANRLRIFEGLLDGLLELTNSEYGFIGEILFRGDGIAHMEENFLKIRGVPYLQTHSITNIAWDTATEQFYQDNYEKGMEFSNLQTLFGAVILTGKPVIANHAITDPRRGGIPTGHPPLEAFLGIPFFKGPELIGMVGIANRPGGYNESIIETLGPFLTTCSNLIEGYRMDRHRQKAEAMIAQQLRQRTVLGQIVQQIRESLNLQEILAITTQRVREILQGDRVIVFRLFDRSRTSILAEAVSEDLPSLKPMNCEDEEWSSEVLQFYWQGQPRIVPDVMNDPWTPCLLDYSHQGQIQSKIVAPILQEIHNGEMGNGEMGNGEIDSWTDPQSGNKLWGLLVIHACHEQRIWQKSDAELLQQIANQLAIAIQQSHLFEKLQEELTERQQTQTQLTQRNEELIRATRLKDEFLANMSHELRTPLNAILGMTEGLQEGVFGPVNDGQQKALSTIERSGSHLLALINDILDVAKIESGQVELECAPTAIAPLCQSSITFVKQQALKKQLQLSVNLPVNLPDIVLDERRIRQVLINLLNNAVKFTPEGGCVTLEVTLPTEKNNPPYLRFSVIDTGIGITPENLTKLFQPFVQIDSALNRQYQGTGLGLALTKRIVELHSGQVGVRSEEGKGSCFMIDLPYQASVVFSPQTDSESNFAPHNLAIQSPGQSSPLLLLAEDNEANISTISSYLMAKGYRIEVAKNGQEAISQAVALSPDLILMDIQMPGMDGLEAMKRIREIPKLATTPIIVLTALAMDSDRDRCLQAGANEYLSKPVKLKQLTMTIQGILNFTRGENI